MFLIKRCITLIELLQISYWLKVLTVNEHDLKYQTFPLKDRYLLI